MQCSPTFRSGKKASAGSNAYPFRYTDGRSFGGLLTQALVRARSLGQRLQRAAQDQELSGESDEEEGGVLAFAGRRGGATLWDEPKRVPGGVEV
jgi:hypothetical protein